MASIVVSEFTGGNQNGSVGLGLLNPAVHATPEAAARDILERRERNRQILESNKQYGTDIKITNIEVHSTSAAPGSKVDLKDIETIKPDVLGKIRSHVKNGLAGVALAGAAGIAAAAEPGATPASVGNAIADTSIPGWAAARQGQACEAFGEATGIVASGLTITAGAAATTTVALGVGAVTGPAAPVTAGGVALGGAALTVKAGDAAYSAGSSIGEAACESVGSGLNKVKSALGLGGT